MAMFLLTLCLIIWLELALIKLLIESVWDHKISKVKNNKQESQARIFLFTGFYLMLAKL